MQSLTIDVDAGTSDHENDYESSCSCDGVGLILGIEAAVTKAIGIGTILVPRIINTVILTKPATTTTACTASMSEIAGRIYEEY